MNAPPPTKFRDPGLVDFGVDARGAGRRLELLGGMLVDRPLPQSRDRRRADATWRETAAVFHGSPSDRGGHWTLADGVPESWPVEVPLPRATLILEARPAPSGQIGVFIEQIEQWRWLAEAARPDMTVLSLFGHSGAASLAAATAGAQVVHVDASRQAIAMARRNAAASLMDHLPVSWICEDAATFVQRCRRRGRRFSGVVLDPPSWGHGPKGQAFSIDRDLVPLLADIASILDPTNMGPLLLSCHSPGWHPARLRDTLKASLDAAGVTLEPPVTSGTLDCLDASGRRLSLGAFARAAPAP